MITEMSLKRKIGVKVLKPITLRKMNKNFVAGYMINR